MSSRSHRNTPWFRWTLLMLGLCLGIPAQADVLKREKDLRPFADTVMKAVGQGDLNAAYAAIAEVSVLPADEIDRGRQASTVQRNQAFIVRYGKTQGHEFLAQKKLGSALVYLVYLERAERHPLIWHFYFYQSPQGWVLSSFGWDDQVGNAFLMQ